MQVRYSNEEKTQEICPQLRDISESLKETFLKRFLFLCLLRCDEKSYFVTIAYQNKNYEAVVSPGFEDL